MENSKQASGSCGESPTKPVAESTHIVKEHDSEAICRLSSIAGNLSIQIESSSTDCAGIDRKKPLPPFRASAPKANYCSPRTSKNQRKSTGRHYKFQCNQLELYVIPENEDRFGGIVPREDVFKSSKGRFPSTSCERKVVNKLQHRPVNIQCRFSSFDRMAAETPPLQPLSVPVRAY